MKFFSEKFIIYFLLCSSCLTISFNVAAIAAVIPAISAELMIPKFVAAEIISYYLVPYGIGALFYAPLTKYISYRRILGISLACYALACLGCAVSPNITGLKFGQAAMGVSGASVIPVSLIVIGQLFEKNVRGRLVGGFFSWSFIGSILGIFFSCGIQWRWLFYIPAAMGMSTAAGLFLCNSDQLKKIHGLDINYLKAFGNAEIRRLFLFIFVISFLYHGVHKWFGVYLDQIYGLNQFSISMFFLVMAIGGAVGQMSGGIISDKLDRYRACMIGILVLSLATISLCGHYSVGLLVLFLVLLSVGWTMGHNGMSTILTDFPDQFRAEIASLNSSVRFIGGGLGFFASIKFVEKSFSMTFLGIGLLMLGLSLTLKKIVPTEMRRLA